MKRTMLNNDWTFGPWREEILQGEPFGEPVRLPHSVCELPLHGADPSMYEGTFAYRRLLHVHMEEGRRFFLHFEGIAHQAWVYLNGRLLGSHHCGYTAFAVEITQALESDKDNVLIVKVDSHEDPSIPPFGFVIDYLTYGGIYRDVWLETCPRDCLRDAFVFGDMYGHVQAALKAEGERQPVHLELLDAAGRCVFVQDDPAGNLLPEFNVENPSLWSPQNPALYLLKIRYGEDERSVSFGFRSLRLGDCSANVNDDAFYINEERIFLFGLNRHQSYPYAGYAMPASLQAEDARILKEELHVNTVRTSHYPQSQAFLDACDRLGLLVITEIPGWQHIGSESWKQTAMSNAQDMVIQDRNHPSVIMWGVRINESQDDDKFYRMTNAIVHGLDPTRPTTGIRYLENSHLLEDVYAYNDFSYDGHGNGCKAKAEVTKAEAPLLITEANGHMFPTKSFDNAARRQEQALRHARVLDAARRDHQHIGCLQWCMFDYATHKDFGSGDRICYHGVMDSFRNPKLAAAVYRSQQEEEPVLEIGSDMDIGDYEAGRLGDVYAFTNADEVRLYKNDKFVQSFFPEPSDGLPHPPIKIDDRIGHLLESEEGMDPDTAAEAAACLQAVERCGQARLPLKYKLRIGRLMALRHFSMADAVRLYGAYAVSWGKDATIWRFDAVKMGRVVKSVKKGPSARLHLEVRASSLVLQEGDTYDAAAVRIRLLNEFDQTASYAQLPVQVEIEKPDLLELIGPGLLTAEGGMTGTYLRTKGPAGTCEVTFRCADLEPAALRFTVRRQD
jgi:beta-galactosidase